MNASGKNRLDHFAVVEFEAFAAREFEFAGVQAQAAQDCCVDVGHVMTVLDGVETQFVRDTLLDAALDAGAGEPRARCTVWTGLRARPSASNASWRDG